MKNSKKNLVKLADVKLTVFQINANGSRGTQYGNLSGINIVRHILLYLSMGNRVIVVADADKAMSDIYGEIHNNNAQRDIEFYDKMLVHSVRLQDIIKA